MLGRGFAHADLRHTSQQLTKAFGIGALLGVIFGEDPGLIPELVAGLAGLEFSRKDEAESDQYSVVVLCETPYAADGAAGFFDKLLGEGGGQVPEFLSTHPSSESRVTDIRGAASEQGCNTEPWPDAQWDALLASLPG